MNHYVITGASGHIGNNLVRYINKIEPNAEITLLSRRETASIFGNIPLNESVGDLSDTEFLSSSIASTDIVIHLAGLIDLSDKRKTELYNTNVVMTQAICNVCRSKHVKKFIYVGSVDGIYKPDPNAVITEPTDYYPDKITGNYGKTKATAAKYVLDALNADNEFNAAIVLPSAVIGTNDLKPSAVGSIILNTIKGKLEFGMNGGYNFVDVKDVCYVIHSISQTDKKGQYIVSGHNVTVKKLYNSINSLLSLKKRPIIIPTLLVYAASPFVKVLSPITIKALLEPHNYSSEKAIKELNLKTTPFEQALSDTVSFFVNSLTKQ